MIIIFGIVGFLFTFGMYLITSPVWIVPRTLVGIAFIISALCIAIAYNIRSKKGRAVLLAVLSVAFLVNVYHMQAMSINQYANNRLDQAYAMDISYVIKDYERETGEKVKKIAFCADDSLSYAYGGNIRYIIGDMNIRTQATYWADTQIVNYYSRLGLTEVKMDENIYNQYFKDKNWDYFVPAEQMIFKDDTVYIAAY
jgi:hypothetical protein